VDFGDENGTEEKVDIDDGDSVPRSVKSPFSEDLGKGREEFGF
jgi:hypothetical protein